MIRSKAAAQQDAEQRQDARPERPPDRRIIIPKPPSLSSTSSLPPSAAAASTALDLLRLASRTTRSHSRAIADLIARHRNRVDRSPSPCESNSNNNIQLEEEEGEEGGEGGVDDTIITELKALALAIEVVLNNIKPTAIGTTATAVRMKKNQPPQSPASSSVVLTSNSSSDCSSSSSNNSNCSSNNSKSSSSSFGLPTPPPRHRLVYPTPPTLLTDHLKGSTFLTDQLKSNTRGRGGFGERDFIVMKSPTAITSSRSITGKIGRPVRVRSASTSPVLNYDPSTIISNRSFSSSSCSSYMNPDPLSTPSLLTEIFDYLIPLAATSTTAFSTMPNNLAASSSTNDENGASSSSSLRRMLSHLCLVNRQWFEVAVTDRYWKRITTVLLPVLDLQPTPTKGYRETLTEYGRCLVQPSVRDGDDWQAGLQLSFEVLDERDGLRLFSAIGPVDLILSSESGLTAIRLTGHGRREVTRAFTAESRDPKQQRFPSVKDYFSQCSQPQYPACLRVRVVATDTRTGRQALLYQSNKATQRSVKVSTLQYWQQWLSPGSLFVWEPWSRWAAVSSSNGYPNSPSSEVVEISTSFYVSPQPPLAGEEGNPSAQQGGGGAAAAVPPQATATEAARRLPHMVMGGDSTAYGDHNSFIALQFRTLDASVPGRYIKAALAGATPPSYQPITSTTTFSASSLGSSSTAVRRGGGNLGVVEAGTGGNGRYNQAGRRERGGVGEEEGNGRVILGG